MTNCTKVKKFYQPVRLVTHSSVSCYVFTLLQEGAKYSTRFMQNITGEVLKKQTRIFNDKAFFFPTA